MDENRRGYDLKAPGHSGGGSSMRLRGRDPFPRVDDHLVEPEVTRDEIVGGHRVVAFPANPPHATQQTRMDYVIQAHVVPGYLAATDLLTRHDEESDFASDTCLFKEGIDPATGARHLEEIVFEVVSEQNERLVTDKARRMHRRGVRRIFAVWVKTHRVCEWSPQSESWRLLEAGARIEDPCLVAPLDVAALLDAAKADYAVVQALAAKDSPAIRERDAAMRAEGRAEGLAQGRAEAILKILEARGIPVSEARRREILSCQDLDHLDRWLLQATVASSAGELTLES